MFLPQPVSNFLSHRYRQSCLQIRCKSTWNFLEVLQERCACIRPLCKNSSIKSCVEARIKLVRRVSNYLDVQKCLHSSCQHFVHKNCLVNDFRLYDEVFGKCPIRDMAHCKRGLMDRIALDRKAIFGSQHSALPKKVQVEFPQSGKALHLQSEEELVAAQLRLLKDYVVAHAADPYEEWISNHVEPAWHTKVIAPAVKLFKGWNMPSQKSQYFADRDAFLKLVAWAELVRIMNLLRAILRDVADVPSYSLAELHRKFLWAKDCYERKERTWKLGHSGFLECENIAHDVYSIAMSTHPDAR